MEKNPQHSIHCNIPKTLKIYNNNKVAFSDEVAYPEYLAW
jgi:hypothetical protein